MTKLINLTPHALTLRSPDGSDTVIEPSGTIARVSSTPGAPEDIEGVPVPIGGHDVFGEVTGLLPAEEGVFFIVSGMVGAACQGRPDVLVPGTGPADGAIRNEKGHIVAITRLKRV